MPNHRNIVFKQLSVTGAGFQPYFVGFLPAGIRGITGISSRLRRAKSLSRVRAIFRLLSGVPSAVPVNSIIVFSCPADHVFQHNTYGEPRWLIRCMDDGEWTKAGDFWPTCFNPSELLHS